MVATHSQFKRSNGRYFTVRNPFPHPAFLDWAAKADLRRRTILEPFAGANNLILHLQEMGLCQSFRSFDIAPAHPEVETRDTLRDFPRDFRVCVTNPPWLAKNSASLRKIPFPQIQHDDLYKVALERCLAHCDWVAALIPESFLRAGIFRERLRDFISLDIGPFEETGHPVSLALFGPEPGAPARVWVGQDFVGALAVLEKLRPLPRRCGPRVRFNDPHGNVGLIAIDNTRGPSIRFCEADELADYPVRASGRYYTKMLVDGPVRIAAWNDFLHEFRAMTRDLLMTCYRGIRRDGKYRRRCDWALARGIIHHVGWYPAAGLRSD